MEKSRLCLSRKVGESILIGNDIKATVTKCKGGHCKIVIEAPKDMKILRDELKIKDAKFVPLKGSSDVG